MNQIARVLYLPPLFLMLIACNLSASSQQSQVTVQDVITVTSSPIANDVNVNTGVQDTAPIIVTIPPTLASSSDSSVSQTESNDLYYARGSQLIGQCTVQAQVNTNIRVDNTITGEIAGQLIGGEWIPVSRIIDGWYQVDLSSSPVHRMWISSEPTALASNCRCDTNGCYIQQEVILTPEANINLYYAGYPQPYPPEGCFVHTAGDFPVNIRTGQSEDASRIGQLRANQWLPVDYIVNGWFGVNLPNTPIDNAYIASGPAILTRTCSCTEFTCKPVTAPGQTCWIETHSANIVTRIHVEPANWSDTYGGLLFGETYEVTTQSDGGWYQLAIGGWIPPNDIKLLDDEACRNVPTIPYAPPLFDCELVNTTGEIQTIYTEPNGDYYGRFGSGLRLGIIRLDQNWYQVYVPAFNSAGWVDGTEMGLSGDCSAFES